MYILANQITALPVMSLQTGQTIATIDRPLINAANLEVKALHCKIGRRKAGVILMRDIRQFANDCVIIDSFDEIEEPGEIVRLKEILKRNFNPMDKLVVNESNHRLGRVEDYTINLKTFMVQKLYVHQSLVKSILFNNLVIDRTQIIDVTDKQFTVKDTGIKEPSLAAQPVSPPPKYPAN